MSSSREERLEQENARLKEELRAAQAQVSVLRRVAQAHASVLSRVIDECVCPITHTLMEEPVLAEDGAVYEMAAIADWLRREQSSPLTRKPMHLTTTPSVSQSKRRRQLTTSCCPSL